MNSRFFLVLFAFALLVTAGLWTHAQPTNNQQNAGTPEQLAPPADTNSSAVSKTASRDDNVATNSDNPTVSAPATEPVASLPDPAGQGGQNAILATNSPSGQVAASPSAAPEPTTPPQSKRRSLADVLEGVDLNIPGERERVVAEMKTIEDQRRAAAVARAKELGMPLRIERPDGGVSEVADIDENGQLLYRTTHNLNAAISTGANLLQAAPYNLSGTNILVGVWDGGAARSTHQEFGGRVTVRDGAASADHATHVAGTIIASGLTASAKGMATAARVDSYEWTSDFSEMVAAGAASATNTNKVLVSNHSYGYLSGWEYINGGSPYRLWTYYGDGSNSSGYEYDFGRYNTYSRDTDATIVSTPFLTTFWSSGNHRTDNPAAGASVTLSSTSTNVVSYSSASHPPGDGVYRNGYEIIGFNGVAKNIITIGAVNDAVTSGTRDPAKATQSSFGSWGPTDDGRIKPDLVANGVSLYSASSAGDSSYVTMSGTSMASPNAAGSAALVVQEYIRLFGGAPRASTMKGMLIHTADDIGTAGPDYQNGWGLMNVKAAVDLVRDAATNPAKARLSEKLITTSSNIITQTFTWDGVSPIRATLCWTDPAGIATTTNDFRGARLVNNLDLRVVSPNGVTNRPYVMPFVGTWTTNAMSQAATTGTNNTDNVEQVYIATPSAAGTYQAVVTYQGTLSGSQQYYSLLISGSGLSAPTISDIPDQTVTLGNTAGPLAFTVGHAEIPTSSLTVSATSSNPTLVPVGNITFGGSDANRTVTVTPATGVTGTSTITLTVSDGASTTSDSFVLTVNAVPDIAVEEYRGSDSSSASVYNDNVFVGRNGGDGFGVWTGSFSGAGGKYIGVTSVRSRSFAVYAGSAVAGNSAEATRALGAPLAVGESLGVELGYTGIANGGEIGMNFFSGGSFRLGLKFIGGTDQWVLNDGGANFGTGLGWSGGTPLQVLFRRNVGNGYSIMLVSGSRSYSAGNLASTLGTMSIDSVQFYSSAQGANEHLGFDALTRGLDVASASPFDFGSVQAGSSGPARTFVVRNDGGATLSSLATAKSGANPADFIMGGTIPASLAAGASASFTLTMSPAGAGARSAVFSITSNDPDESPVNVSLNGTGTKGTATINFGNLSQTYKGEGAGTLLSEDFSSLTSGGDTATTGAGSPSSTEITSNLTTNFPVSVKAYSAGGAVKLGTGSLAGSITSRSLDLSACSGSFNVAFKVKGWTTNEGDIRVTAGSLPPQTVAYTAVISNASYEPEILSFTGGQSNSTIKIETTNKRAFIDDVVITASAACPVSVATTPSGLSTSVTYNGSFSAPTNAGTYTVVATVNDANFEGSSTNTLTILKAPAAIVLGNVSQIYDGTARVVTSSTAPSGLATAVTYNGSSSAPTNVGAYAVVATITDPNYEGNAVGTLTVAKASAGVSLGNLSQVYDGTAREVSVGTTPVGLSTSVTYDGNASAPTNAGTYSVVATVNDANYEGSTTNTLTVARATPVINEVPAASAITYGQTLASSVLSGGSASVSGTFAFTAPTTAPDAGTNSQSITFSPSDSGNYDAVSTDIQVTVNKASATVEIGNLSQTYDGTARPVTVTTTPPDLATSVTYDGGATVPIDIGSYAVVATVTDPNYEGNVSGTLQISKESASINLSGLEQTYDGSPKPVSASTDPSGLSVGLTYDGSSNAPVDAGTYFVVATIEDATYAGSATNTLSVNKAIAGVSFDNLSQVYDGTAREVSVGTTPVGLSTSVTYDGNASAPTNAGTYSVVATVNDANYEGSTTNTLTVARATPVINEVPAASAITYGQTLASSVLSGGSASVSGTFAFTAPTTAPDAGTNSQSITFSPSDSGNYDALSTDIQVTVNKAPATVEIGNLSQTYDGTARAVTVTTTPPGLATSVTYNGSAVVPTDVGSYTVVATVTDPNYEGSSSATLSIVASGVTFESLFGDSDPASDSDGDGVPALVEYALGGATNSDDIQLLPSIYPGLPLGLVAAVRTNNTDNLSIHAQVSTGLAGGWSPELVPGIRSEDQSDVPENFERRVYFFDAGTNSQTFMRLRFILQPTNTQ